MMTINESEDFRRTAYLKLDAQWIAEIAAGVKPRPPERTEAEATAGLATAQAALAANKDPQAKTFLEENVAYWADEITRAIERAKHVPTPEELDQIAAEDAAYIAELKAIQVVRGNLPANDQKETALDAGRRKELIAARYAEAQKLATAGKLTTAELATFADLKTAVDTKQTVAVDAAILEAVSLTP